MAGIYTLFKQRAMHPKSPTGRSEGLKRRESVAKHEAPIG